MDRGFFSFFSDELYLKIKYKLITGEKLDLENPVTYNQKLQWLKLYNRNPEYTKLVDKYEVKEIVSKKIGEKYVIPTIGVYDSFDDIDFSILPNQFVIKPNHTSGDVFICHDKDEIDYKKLKKTIEKWLKRKYFYIHREWPYKDIKPKIIIEKYMVDLSNSQLMDYKFFCFNGKAKMLFVAKDRPYATKFNFYDIDFKKIELKQHYPNFEDNLPKPKNYDKMIELAEKLSVGMPHVRIDLYNVDGKIYFGEYTFFHFSGFEKIEPSFWNKRLGDMIDIGDIKNG